MAIDATILAVDRDGKDLLLTLGPRIQDDDRNTIAGQSKLRILNATWAPDPGMDIWGGGSSVQILTGHAGAGPWYERVGYTTLIEKHPLPSAPTRWAESNR